MSSGDLWRFYQSVEVWPQSEAEWRKVMESVRELLGSEATVLRTIEDGLALELMVPAPVTAEITSKTAAWIESKFNRQGQLQLIPSGDSQPIRNYWVAPVGRTGSKGWIAAGSKQPLNESQKTLLLSVAQRLTALWEVFDLRLALSQRDQFLSIASHELKTPLTSIYGLIQLQTRILKKNQMGQSSPITPEKQGEFLRIVTRQSERLNELIDGLLDVSRIQNGRFGVEPSQSEIAAIIRETVLHRLRVPAEESGVTVQVDAPEKLDAWIDPVRFEEVVTNLGMNAIRFSPEGGVVWIRAVQVGKDGMKLSVRDQGPSVPEADRLRIFLPFEKASRTTRLGGLGLGLFISRQIAQLHGGDVKLSESLPGKGNLFVAHFPGRSVLEKSA